MNQFLSLKPNKELQVQSLHVPEFYSQRKMYSYGKKKKNLYFCVATYKLKNLASQMEVSLLVSSRESEMSALAWIAQLVTKHWHQASGL